MVNAIVAASHKHVGRSMPSAFISDSSSPPIGAALPTLCEPAVAQARSAPTGATLLVVDWSAQAAQELRDDLHSVLGIDTTTAGAREDTEVQDARLDWDVLNCPASPAQGGPARRGIARARLALQYLGTAWRAAWHSRRYAQVVVWQQAIGYLMCLLPRWPAWMCAAGVGTTSHRPRLIITTVLWSPSCTPPWSWPRGWLWLALHRADALVYFSRDMALDTARHHPDHAHKVFWTALPHFEKETGQQLLPGSLPGTRPDGGPGTLTHTPPDEHAPMPCEHPSAGSAKPLRVFAGGSSERDFDVVIRAFRGTEVPVTLVCRGDQAFEAPGPEGDNFHVYREVSHAKFEALTREAEVAVVALKSSSSGCGQLLFSFCMRHGIPVIATDCYGTRDYVLPEVSGLLVPAGDERALRHAYDRLARDTALRHRLIREARAQSARNGLAGFVHAIEDISRQLTAQA